jgi:hypothetical protein
MALRGYKKRFEVLGITRDLFGEGDGKMFHPHVHELVLVIVCKYDHQ